MAISSKGASMSNAGRRWRLAFGGMWLFAALLFPVGHGSEASPSFRFKALPGPVPIGLAHAVLTESERGFVAQLPEIRVALVKVGAPPYETVSADGEVGGFQAEMLMRLARALGLSVRPLVFENWPSLLQAVRERRADVVMTVSMTPDRLEYLAFTLATVPVPAAVFAMQGVPVPASLNQARIALERDYYSNDLVRRQYPGATIVPTLTTVQALRAVKEGRADYYLGSLLEANHFLTEEPVPGMEVRDVLQSGSGMYHFAVRKDWAVLANILNKGILRYRADAQGAAWAAVMAGLPAGVAVAHPMPLSDSESALLAQRSVWRVGAVRGLAMLNEVDDKGLHSGIAAEYTEHVARRLGVGIEVVPFANVADMLDGLRQGQVDFIPFLTWTKERARDFGFSEPYFEMPYMLVGRSDAPLYWDLGSLKGRRLALARAHPLRELMARKYPGIHVIDANNGNEAMDMVARGDADAAVEIKVFANLRINDDPMGRLRSLGPVGDLPAQFRFAAGQSTRVLLPLIDRVLGEISPSERERMSRRWVAIDFNPPFPWRRHLPVIMVSSGALLSIALGTFWWMRRLAREVRARRRVDEQLLDIGRTLPVAAFRDVQDASGRIRRRFFSSGSRRFLGIEPRPGQAVIDALLPQLGEADAALLSQMQTRHLNEDRPLTFTGQYAHPDGRKIWLHIEAVRTQSGGDKVSTGYAVDVSAERRLQEELSKEASEKHLLLASASHELRAPTHTLSLALQSIPTDGLPGSSVRGLRIARDAARTLGQLLDDVLDVARFDSGHAELRLQDFDLRALIDQVRDAHAGPMAAKGLNFQCDVAADIPQMICLDPLRVKQVLTNLLSNAARYTHHGGVDLRVSRARPVPGGPQAEVMMIEFVVSDTGQGLSPERQSAPFEAYGCSAQAEGSTGLGLSICHRFVQMMGGDIRLHSQPGQGTQAHVLLPISVRPRRSTSPQVPVRHEGALLLCDDDPVCRMLVAEGLSHRGYAVVQAGGGEEALEVWRHGGACALITDLSMPGLGGATLIDTVLAEEAGQPERTAVLICSGDLAPLASATRTLPPHDAFLTKPVDVGTLVKALNGLGLTGAATH